MDKNKAEKEDEDCWGGSILENFLIIYVMIHKIIVF